MEIQKSCLNCTDNRNCPMIKRLDTLDIVGEFEYKVEEGIFHEILQEGVRLTPTIDQFTGRWYN